MLATLRHNDPFGMRAIGTLTALDRGDNNCFIVQVVCPR
jgi:hypothetical protein